MTKYINKITLFLSALAIVLIVLLLMRFKGLTLFKNASANEIPSDEATVTVQNYVEAQDGFTDSQKEALDLFINDFFSKQSVTTEDDMGIVYKIIDEKYASNMDSLKEIRDELQMKLNAASVSDNTKFEEINNLIQQIDQLLADANDTSAYYRKGLKEALEKSQVESDKQDEKILKDVDELSKNTVEKFEKTHSDINALDKGTTIKFENVINMLEQLDADTDEEFTNVHNIIVELTKTTNEELTELNSSFNSKLNALHEETQAQNKQLKDDLDNNVHNLSNDISTKETGLKGLINDLSEKLALQNKNLTNLINQLTSAYKQDDEKLNAIINNNATNFKSETNNLGNQINSLSSTVKQNNDKIWEEINKLNKRTTNNGAEFKFGYSNGVYGFYDSTGAFKPF